MNLLTQLGVSDWARGFKPVTCSAEPCRRWLTERQLHVRRVGVTVGEAWYCSYACALQRVEMLLQDLLLPRAQRRAMPTRPSLGMTLVRRGLLSDEQYKTAVQMQQSGNEESGERSGEEFGELVVRLGYMTEEKVTESRALHWSCPVFSCVPGLAGPRVHVPPFLRRLHSMVPLHLSPSGNRLFVGFQYGVEYAPLFALEQVVGCSTQPCLISPQDFARLNGESAGDASVEQRCVKGLKSAEEMAQALCGSARAMHAERLTMTRCGDVLWCRMAVGVKMADLLFQLGSL